VLATQEKVLADSLSLSVACEGCGKAVLMERRGQNGSFLGVAKKCLWCNWEDSSSPCRPLLKKNAKR